MTQELEEILKKTEIIFKKKRKKNIKYHWSDIGKKIKKLKM